ncbi:hypothetical protein DIPPA_32151 [Diplonema papillatum]|nr:hypothetical protein DIPPA_32151 [Diplonema papillatum]
MVTWTRPTVFGGLWALQAGAWYPRDRIRFCRWRWSIRDAVGSNLMVSTSFFAAPSYVLCTVPMTNFPLNTSSDRSSSSLPTLSFASPSVNIPDPHNPRSPIPSLPPSISPNASTTIAPPFFSISLTDNVYTPFSPLLQTTSLSFSLSAALLLLLPIPSLPPVVPLSRVKLLISGW